MAQAPSSGGGSQAPGGGGWAHLAAAAKEVAAEKGVKAIGVLERVGKAVVSDATQQWAA